MLERLCVSPDHGKPFLKFRITRGCRTTRANRQCCRWLEAWRANWDPREYASTRSLRDTYTLRTYAYFRKERRVDGHGVNEHDCAEWDKEAIGTGAQS
jgi:hypothetical protein